MKKILVILLVTFLLISSSGAVLADKQDFILVNEIGVTIYKLYISPANSVDWEEDVLGDSVLSYGKSIRIYFSGSWENYWDMMIVDKYGNERICENLNLSQITKITLYANGNSVWADIEN